MTEPPVKKIKAGQEFMELIVECYNMKFNVAQGHEPNDKLTVGIQKIRETLEQISTSSDISFGASRTAAKINWGKCLGLLLEDEDNSLNAIRILTDTLSPGGGLL